MRPKVSVIVAVYNCSPYLKRCVESILYQTLNDIEIILIDDGSTDDSLSILQSYEKKDSRIRVVSRENGGGGAARNTGLDLAQGEYLSFLDSDDFFEADMLKVAYDACQAKNADICVFRCDLYDEEKDAFFPGDWTIRREYLPKKEPFALRDFSDRAFFAFIGWAWDKLIRRDMVQKNELRFQEIRTSNDLYFVFTALLCAERIVTLERVLVHQRRRATNSLSTTRERSWHCFLDALDELESFLRVREMYEAYERGFLNYALHFSLWNLNSLTGSSYKKVFEALRSEYFPKWRLDALPESYLLSEGERNQLYRILGMPFEEYVVDSMNAYRQSYFRLKAQLEQKGELPEDSARAALRAVEKSLSYKIGRAITFLPRKLRR